MRVVIAVAVTVVSFAGCAVAPRPNGNGSAAVGGGSMEAVVSRTFTVQGFELESGQKLPEMTLAFATWGTLAPSGRNAILITHGFTSSHFAAGTSTPTGAPGWWNGLIGPGKTIDTNRHFVVASNMLGSSYGSTAPASVNPATGTRYGPDFPAITLRDMVRAQKLLLESLGVHHLVAVAGPSFGGFQAFQWAVQYPDFMDGVVPVVTSPKMRAGSGTDDLVNAFAKDPNWNGGWHYDRGGIPETMAALRVETLRRYGQNEILAVTIPDQPARDARIREMAEAWAKQFDPNSMIALRKASMRFDVEPELGKIRAKVLYVLSRTDKLFPPSLAPAVMDKLARAGVDAKYVEIDTEFGHSASGADWQKWAPALQEFLARLSR